MKNTLTIHIQNRLSELEKVNQRLQTFFNAHPQSMHVRNAVHLAIDELISNIILHGYADRADHQIEIRVALVEDHLVVKIEDDARPFNPLTAPPADTESSLSERPIGGLGIHLVRNLMDTLHYEYRNQHNVLTLKIATEEP